MKQKTWYFKKINKIDKTFSQTNQKQEGIDLNQQNWR
jgi:hypothetical protein